MTYTDVSSAAYPRSEVGQTELSSAVGFVQSVLHTEASFSHSAARTGGRHRWKCCFLGIDFSPVDSDFDAVQRFIADKPSQETNWKDGFEHQKLAV